MQSPRARSTWFCVDIECNGPVPGLYDMVSLGAVRVVPNGRGGHRADEEFYAELRPSAPRFDARAAAIHGLDQDTLRREGLPRREFCKRLDQWVRKHTLEGSDPCFVGHNAAFDWSFVAYIYAEQEMPNPFGYKALDTKAMATGALGIHWLDSSKETLADALQLPQEDRGQKHRADYDARYQAEILIALLNRAPYAS